MKNEWNPRGRDKRRQRKEEKQCGRAKMWDGGQFKVHN